MLGNKIPGALYFFLRSAFAGEVCLISKTEALLERHLSFYLPVWGLAASPMVWIFHFFGLSLYLGQGGAGAFEPILLPHS